MIRLSFMGLLQGLDFWRPCPLRPKQAFRNTRFAFRAWIIPAGAAAPSTLFRIARPQRPVQRPNAWPIRGIKPVLTRLHHLPR